MTCPYCKHPAAKVTGATLYPYLPKLARRWFYVCRDCDASVGCHPGTDTPLGSLANAELRKLRTAAHAAFDPLWQRKMRRDECTKREARGAGYEWLAGQLGIAVEQCHIGHFGPELCRRVIEICQAVGQRKGAAA